VSPGLIAAIFMLSGSAAFAQSLTGFGFGLLIVPPLVLLLGAKEAVLVSNVLSTALVVLLAARLYRHVDRRAWFLLTMGSIAGMPLGLVVLIFVRPELLQAIIAINVIVFTVLLTRRWTISAGGKANDIATGIVSGVLRTSTSMSGPPIVIYLQGKGMDATTFRATISAFFLTSGLLAMATFAAAGRFSVDTWQACAAGLPGVFVGMVAGNRVFHRVDEARFRQLVILLLFVSAAIALVMVAVG